MEQIDANEINRELQEALSKLMWEQLPIIAEEYPQVLDIDPKLIARLVQVGAIFATDQALAVYRKHH